MLNNKKVAMLIAAAGSGSRMQLKMNKQFISLGGQSVLSRTIEQVSASKYIDCILVIGQEQELDLIHELLKGIQIPYQLVAGGNTRQDSILNGLKALDSSVDIVASHDGARPFVSVDAIDEVIEAVEDTGASVLAHPVKDTIKFSANGQYVAYTPARELLWAVQTPQVFYRNIIESAYKQAYDEDYQGTDDCSLVEKSGHKVKIVQGEYTNIKITTPEDLLFAEILQEEPATILQKYGYGENL